MRPVTLVDYDPQWPLLFKSRSKAIGRILGRPAEFHHIGSTAIAGLCAKPKLDIDAVLFSEDARRDATERKTDIAFMAIRMMPDVGPSPRMRRLAARDFIFACLTTRRIGSASSFATICAPIPIVLPNMRP